jgi:hypothetical protein
MATDWMTRIGARPLGKRPVVAPRRTTRAPGTPTKVEHIELDLVQWDGPIGDWKEHYGKGEGQVRSLHGTEPLRSCNEVEVAKQLMDVRDHAYWFSGFGISTLPEIWKPWARGFRDAPDWLTSLDARVQKRIVATGIDATRRKPGDGMPDVVAWDDSDPLSSALFIECKGGEAFGQSQEDWVWGARRAGVRVAQLAVSLRPF